MLVWPPCNVRQPTKLPFDWRLSRIFTERICRIRKKWKLSICWVKWLPRMGSGAVVSREVGAFELEVSAGIVG